MTYSKQLSSLDFSGLSERTGPMSWPQHAIWSIIRTQGEKARFNNLHVVWQLPEATTSQQVLDVFLVLLRHCETLRTTYRPGSGWPRQVVHGSGSVPVHRYDVVADELVPCMATFLHDVRDVSFDLEAGSPFRIGIVLVGGRPVRTIAVFSHVAVDGWSREILRTLFEEVLAGGPAALDRYAGRDQQPVERAEFERSPAGVASARRTIEFWRQAFNAIPTANFTGVLEGEELPEKAGMRSQLLADAMQAICASGDFKSSAVMMGLVSLVLSAVFDAPEIALRTLVATRFRRAARCSVAALNLNGLFRLDVRHESVRDHFRRSMGASMAAVRYSECDPAELERQLETVMRARGVPANQCLYFNDLVRIANLPREGDERTAYDDVGIGRRQPVPGFDQGDGGTRYEMIEVPQVDRGKKFMLAMIGMAEEANLTLYLDRRSMPVGAVDILRSIEQLAVAAAADLDADAVELSRSCWARA